MFLCSIRRAVPAIPAVLAFTAVHAAAQTPAGSLASQNLRPYVHVFIAYAVVIALILGWVVSIGRRLSDVERKLSDES